MGEALISAIADLQDDEALRLIKQALGQGEDPHHMLEDCQAAMKIVGNRFSKGEYFLPELIMSGEVVRQVFEVVKPKLTGQDELKGGAARKEEIILGTVRGDVHNIGKDIVSFLLDVNGYAVRDLGIDVPEEKFVEEIKQMKPRIVALSGLLTAAYDSMKSTVDAINKAGLRDGVKIIIGGGQIDEAIKGYVGADAYGKDAFAAVDFAKLWIPGK